MECARWRIFNDGTNQLKSWDLQRCSSSSHRINYWCIFCCRHLLQKVRERLLQKGVLDLIDSASEIVDVVVLQCALSVWNMQPSLCGLCKLNIKQSISVGTRTWQESISVGWRRENVFRVEHETWNGPSSEFLNIIYWKQPWKLFPNFTKHRLMESEWPSPLYILTTHHLGSRFTILSDSFLGEEKKQPTHLFNSRIIREYHIDEFYSTQKVKRIDRSIEDWIAIQLCTIFISALPCIQDNTRQSG